MFFDAADIARYFNAKTISRGRQYYRSGRVQRLRVAPDGAVLNAQVKGSRSKPYEVSVQIRPLARRTSGIQIDGDCSCPMGFNCKHVVATLLAAMGQRTNVRSVASSTTTGQPQSQPQPQPQPQPQHLPYPTTNWLTRLQQASRQSATGRAAETREQVLYLLYPHLQESGLLGVTVASARILKAGGYGKTRAISVQSIAYGSRPNYFDDDDVLIVHDLAHQQSGADRLTGVLGGRLLERMLATGRAYWRNTDAPPLQQGEPRAAEPVWLTDDQGLSRLGFATRPGSDRLFALQPPWYMDSEQGICGPISTELPAMLAAELVAAPSMRAEELQQVQDWLVQHLPGVRLPPPPELAIKHVTDYKPRPQLKLHTRQRNYFYGRRQNQPGSAVHCARLGFDYVGQIVHPWQNMRSFDRYRDNCLWRIQRNPPVEGSYIRRLLELGMDALTIFEDERSLPIDLHNDLGLADDDAWISFMLECVPRLRAEGWNIVIDPDFAFNIAEAGDWFGELYEGSGIDWFGIALGVEVDGNPLNLLPLLASYHRHKSALGEADWLQKLGDDDNLMLPLADGRRLPLPVARVRGILEVLIELTDDPSLGPDGQLELPQIQAARLIDLQNSLAGTPMRWEGNRAVLELAERLRSSERAERLPAPPGLKAELREYQQQGLAWLQALSTAQLGGVLADDMGLGKTIQTLAHILTEKEAGRVSLPSLIVAPTSLMTNWRNEAARFAPDLRVLTLQGPRRSADFDKIPRADIVLTTYPLLPRDREELQAHHYHFLILDEAQAIKNPKSQAGLVARNFHSRQRLCLTGTPMENHLGELWSLFDFLMPGLLGDDKQFRRLFRRPVEQFGDLERRNCLARRVRPFLLRRTKEQVATELPPKTEMIRTIGLHGSQRDLYESIRFTMQDKVRAQIRRNGLARSYIIILEALLKLRQVCCDPRLVKLESARAVTQSAKLDLLLELLPGLIEDGRRILLFSQFTGMLSLIEKAVTKLKIPFVKLTGQTRDRATPIGQFQNGEVPLFLISLKAGGVGLNLTAADTVIHYDPWWNPAVEEQATDRAHRIGQDKPVFVYKLYTEGTVEEKIRELQERKRALTEGLLDDAGDAATQWTESDLDFLLAPLAEL